MSLPPRFCDKAQQTKAREVAREDVIGALMLREGLDVVEGLLFGRHEVATRTFHFNDDGSRNKRVDKSMLARRRTPRALLVYGSRAAADAEASKEAAHKLLCLALFIAFRIAPLRHERARAVANIGKNERFWHGGS